MSLDRYPRLPLAHLPTPLEPLARLSELLGGPRIWVKRDDCTGLAMGGNKTRKLEYVMAAARDHGADTVITGGAVQSNHALLTAAAAARCGMDCHLLLEEITLVADQDYVTSGNVLLDGLCGARVSIHPQGTDLQAAMEALAETLRNSGRKPYLIPIGASIPLGALGYVDCAMELMAQARERNLALTGIIHATGSAGTQAGLIAGLHLQRETVQVLGICVSRTAEEQEEKVYPLACETLALLDCKRRLPRSMVRANSDYVGEGDGLPTEAMLEAVALTARSEGLLLDPVYTGKAMAGLIDLVRRGEFDHGDNVVFLHTGGSPALFGYRGIFKDL